MDAVPTDPAPGGLLVPTPPSLPRPRAPRAPRAKAPPRPLPVRNADFDHLTLAALRTYRSALTDEENRVSYWRRILQARLDVLREGRLPTVDPAQLSAVLTNARVSSGRTSLIQVMPIDDIPPLPDLASLWARQVDHDTPDNADRRADLEHDLVEAEEQLSQYRSALHLRLGAATGELIARYRQDPVLCLSALPVRPTGTRG